MDKFEKIITLDLAEEAVRLSEMTGISEDEAYAFVLAEDNFFDMKGLNDYGDGTFVEPENNFIDCTEMLLYISQRTGIEMHKCEMLDSAEMLYYEEIGVM